MLLWVACWSDLVVVIKVGGIKTRRGEIGRRYTNKHSGGKAAQDSKPTTSYVDERHNV